MQGERFPGWRDGPDQPDLTQVLDELLPAAGIALVRVDPQGVIADADALALELLAGGAEIVGAALSECFDGAEGPHVLECLAEALACRQVATVLCSAEDGQQLDLHASSTLWPDGGFGWLLLIRAVPADDRPAGVPAHEALRRVAAAVARADDTDAVFGLVARELVGVLEIDSAGVVRIDAAGTATLVGFHAAGGTSRAERGSQVPIEPGSVLAEALGRGEPARSTIDARARLGPSVFEERVAAPIQLPHAVWGAVLVAATAPGAMPDDAEERVAAFADLLALSLAHDEPRPAEGALRAAVGRDRPLSDAGQFHERLRVEVERARRHRRDLSLAVFDVDGFARVNEAYGRDVGDAVLGEMGERLSELTRSTELVARLGGDELALLLPETAGDGALAAVERIRRAITSVPFSPGFLTVSAGVCDLQHARTAEELFRMADEALCRAKAEGRNRVRGYTPPIPGASLRRDGASGERSAALGALRALAAAVDAREPDCLGHCERVSQLAARLAAVSGWAPGRVALLRDAALLHDVGKIGLPDAILGRRGPITAAEYGLVKEHADRGSAMVASVLTAEQAAWVRGHHERPDGTGYPDGLSAEQIPLGAALLAIAEAWDAMVTARPPRPPRAPREALAECETQSGRQFTPEAVATLRTLWAAGVFDDAGAVLQPPTGETPAL